MVLFPGPRNSTVEFSQNKYCHLIAEIGLNHNGSLILAKENLRKAVLSGCSFLKIQKRSPLDLTSEKMLKEGFDKCPAFGSTQLQVRQRHEFNEDEFNELMHYADSLGALLFTSVFDIPSLYFAIKCKCKIIKIASHSNTNSELLNEINKSRLPSIMSTGGASIEEIDKAVNILSDTDLALMHCVSSYPTAKHLSYLGTIDYLNKRYHIPVGFSSHEEGISQSIAASALGACLIERHVTLSKTMEGLDHKISLTYEQLSELRDHIDKITGSLGVKKEILKEELMARENYHVGVYSKESLKKGDTLELGKNVFLKQPAGDPRHYLTGLIFANYDQPIKVNCDIEASERIRNDQVMS